MCVWRACSTAVWRHLWGRCCVAVVWSCPLAPGTLADVFIWDCEGPQWAKGHVKDYEVGANVILLLIVLRLWEGRAIKRFLCPMCLLFLGAILGRGGGAQDSDICRPLFKVECRHSFIVNKHDSLMQQGLMAPGNTRAHSAHSHEHLGIGGVLATTAACQDPGPSTLRCSPRQSFPSVPCPRHSPPLVLYAPQHLVDRSARRLPKASGLGEPRPRGLALPCGLCGVPHRRHQRQRCGGRGPAVPAPMPPPQEPQPPHAPLDPAVPSGGKGASGGDEGGARA